MKELEIGTVEISHENYPKLLKYIKDAPKVLYYRGNLSLASQDSIAIVGARKASEYGKWAAYRLAEKLAQYDVITTSGMAYGIDTAAHKGSMENGGKTIAVLGCGVDICYPASNAKLMSKIAEEGLILSEFEPGVTPMPYRFPLRNRIISGISMGTIVAEAGLNSGSLITAEHAAEQGRNIYAVPGNINNVYSLGANKLIKDGATPIVVLDDIIDDLRIERRILPMQDQKILGEDEKIIYHFIFENGEVTTDFLCRVTGKRVSEVNAMITVLEMKGIVQTALGKIFIAK